MAAWALVLTGLLAVAPVVADDAAPASRQVVAFVEDAAALVEREGEAAFPRFREPDSRWFRGDRYVFVMTTGGVEVVNPAFPNLEGRNLMDHRDAAGKPLVREMVERTGTGTAWVDYYWARPGTAEQVPKTSYVRRVTVAGEEMIVGAGLYDRAAGAGGAAR